jgi:hypothetical protein
MKLTAENREFLLNELDQVRKDYEGFIEETRRLERYAIVIIGVTWSWCASNADSFAFHLLIWFPAAACALFGIRAGAIHVQARAARRYIANVERALELPIQLGWGNDQMKQSRGIPALVAITAYLFWFVVSVGTVAIPLILRSHGGT